MTDEFSHGCVDLKAGYGISGLYATQLLEKAARFRVYPCAVRTDNGPALNSLAFVGWTQEHGIEHILIEPARSMQTGYIEGFNDNFRNECLSGH